MQQPNFFIIGAAKSGTTTLYNLLRQHPLVYMCPKKEPRHFSLPSPRFEQNWKTYLSYYSKTPENAIAVGEASTIYTARSENIGHETPKRIHSYCPDAKLLYIVRNPYERLVSAWLMANRERPDVFNDFQNDIRRIEHRRWFVDRSRYWYQLSAYHDYFPKKQISVLFLDDLKKDPPRVLAKCECFLALPEFTQYTDMTSPQNAASSGSPTHLMRLLSRYKAPKLLSQLLPARWKNQLKSSSWMTRHNSPTLQQNHDLRVPDDIVQTIQQDLEVFLKQYGTGSMLWTPPVPDDEK